MNKSCEFKRVLNQGDLIASILLSRHKVNGSSHIHEMFAIHMTISPPESPKAFAELVVQG